MLLIRHNIAVKRSFNSSLICYLALALLNPVIHCHQIPNLGAVGSNPAGDTTTLLRIRSPAESWGLESAGLLRFCGNDLGLRRRNECSKLSPKGRFSPRPGTRAVLAPGHSALKYIELPVPHRTVS